MSDPTVTAFLTKVLCSRGGRLPKHVLSWSLELSTEQMEEILQEEPHKFPQVGELVLAQNPVRICAKYLKNEAEEECDKLHLCRNHLLGNCKRPRCTFSHDILSDQNQKVLKTNEISGLNEDEIKVLLLQNDNQLLPGVCVKYLQDACDLGKDCRWLHICGFFTRGECNRRFCKRSHHLLESGSDLLLTRHRMSEESIQNFQMICTVKYNERLQTLRAEGKKDQERGQPGAQRGRGRGRPRNRKKGEPQDGTRSNNQGQRQGRAGFHSQGRSGSRPASESGESHPCGHGGDDDDNSQISPNNKKIPARCPSSVQPLMLLKTYPPKPTVHTSHVGQSRVDVQSTLPSVSPKVSPQPGIQTGHSSSSSTPSAPQPKSTFTPVTTVDSVNVPTVSAAGQSRPVHIPMKGQSDANSVRSSPSPVGNPSTAPVPPSTPSRLVNSPTKGQYFPQDKLEITPIANPNKTQPVVNLTTPTASPSITSTTSGLNKPVHLPMKGQSDANSVRPSPSPVGNPSTAPVPLSTPSRLVNSPTKGPSVPQDKLETTPIATPNKTQPVVNLTTPTASPSITSTTSGLNKPAHLPMKGQADANSVRPSLSPVGNPSTAPVPPSTLSRLVNSPTKDPFFPQDKLETTPIANPNKAQPVVNLTTPTASPSITSTTSGPRLVDSPTEGPSVQRVKPVQSSAASSAQTRIKPISQTELEDIYTAWHLNEDVEDWAIIHPSDTGHQAQRTSMNGASYLPPKRSEPERVPEICLSNIWKYCKIGVCCPNMHYYLPYRWQINKGIDWEDISNMEEIEKCYCDPKVDRVPSVDFLNMRSGMHRVRRLSTVSSVVKPPEYVLTTEWLWYWKDEYGTWTQYGQSNVKQVSATILSSDLENIYLFDPTAVIPFTAGSQRYQIDFREMKQRNIYYKTEKDVRRRPKYLSFEDVKLLGGSTKSSSTKSLMIYPRIWDVSALPEIGCKKVPVSVTSSEFSEIVSSFTKTVSGHAVKKLWRLQNPSLWQLFQWQKEQMKKENQGRDVKELRAFHGTDTTHIDAICNQNFDWRICGTHGTVYGQGSYFARDASYSHNYSAVGPDGTRSMFVARILVGDYVEGDRQMMRPPKRPGSSRYYDSCVDNILNPSIFVVFEKHQIYPEYLLEYQQQISWAIY